MDCFFSDLWNAPKAYRIYLDGSQAWSWRVETTDTVLIWLGSVYTTQGSDLKLTYNNVRPLGIDLKPLPFFIGQIKLGFMALNILGGGLLPGRGSGCVFIAVSRITVQAQILPFTDCGK